MSILGGTSQHQATDEQADQAIASVHGPLVLLQQVFARPGEALSLLTMFGFLVYGLMWLCYSGFYQRLKLDADEVGLSYVTILSRAAIGTLIIIVVGLFILSIPALFGADDSDLEHAPAVNRLLRVYGFASGMMVGLLVWALYPLIMVLTASVVPRGYWRWTDRFGGVLGTTVASLSFGILYALPFIALGVIRSRPSRRVFRPVGLWISGNPTRFTVAKAGVVLFLFLAILVLPYAGGYRLAISVEQRRADGVISTIALDWFLNIQAEAVSVNWMEGKAPFSVPSQPNYLYLGRANEMTVLFETTEKRVYRIPSSAVAMQSADT